MALELEKGRHGAEVNNSRLTGRVSNQLLVNILDLKVVKLKYSQLTILVRSDKMEKIRSISG